MNKAQILRKKTGIILAVVGIVLSLLPALRMTDGSKRTIFQLLLSRELFDSNIVTSGIAGAGGYLTGIILVVILVYGLLVHILNLILWLRKKEKTYIGVMGLSMGSFLAMIMSAVMAALNNDGLVALFPFTIWQCIRMFICLAEAIVKLHGEELFNVFFLNNEK